MHAVFRRTNVQPKVDVGTDIGRFHTALWQTTRNSLPHPLFQQPLFQSSPFLWRAAQPHRITLCTS